MSKKEKNLKKTSQKEENIPSTEEKTDDLMHKSNGGELLDVSVQMGILKLCLEDDFYCTQAVKYLYEDKDLKSHTKIVFANENLTKLFIKLSETYNEFEVRPNINVLKQKIFEMKNSKDRTNLEDTLEKVLSVDIERSEEFYRNFLTKFVRQVKLARAMSKVKDTFVEDSDNALSYFQETLDDINKVSFEEDNVISMEDLPRFLLSTNKHQRRIPTGIKGLDKVLHGGIPTGTLSIILAGTNVGKTIFLVSVASNALRAVDKDGKNLGLKVLHINLEGSESGALFKYTSNLARVPLEDIVQENYDKEQYQEMEKVRHKYGQDRLRIISMVGFNKRTIEELAALCKEEYKTFKFDVLAVDYGQLLETSNKKLDHRFVMAKVHKGLDALAKEFNCACITPVQSTREGQALENTFEGNESSKAPVLRSKDISESYDIARVAEIILSLNITDEEREKGRLRVFLEKQREGIKGTTYGLITDYPRTNLITGKEYNPNSMMVSGDFDFPEDSVERVSMSDENSVVDEIKNDPIDDLVLEILSLKEKVAELKIDYNTARDNEDYEKTEELEEKYDLAKGNLSASKDIFKKSFNKMYPNANKDQFDEIKKQLADLQKDGNQSKITQTKKIYDRFKLGLED